MNLHKSVLPRDRRLAQDLYDCCHSSLNRARMEYLQNEFDEAEKWVKEFQRCKRDLDHLFEKKKQHDLLRELNYQKKELSI